MLCLFWTLIQFSSVAESCPTLCNPMNRSTPGLPVHHQLLEFTRTHVHRVSDAIQPSHPRLSPSPPAWISAPRPERGGWQLGTEGATGTMALLQADSSVQLTSVAQSCPTLCDPMNRSTPGLPVHHQLPEFTQTHVRRVRDAIQPSHPRSSPFPPAPNPSQHQSLFQ